MYTKDTGKTYQGTKTIRAWPMSRTDYNAYRGWTLPADENGADTGYMVEYLDAAGKNPNHPDHEGYISWSPSNVFEGIYREVAADFPEPDLEDGEPGQLEDDADDEPEDDQEYERSQLQD